MIDNLLEQQPVQPAEQDENWNALLDRMEVVMLGDEKGSKKAAKRLLAIKGDVQRAAREMVEWLDQPDADPEELDEQLEQQFDFNHRERVETWIDAGKLTVQGLPRTHQMVVGLFACKMNETLINQLPDGDDLIDRLTHEFEQVDQLDDPDFTNPDFLEQMAEAFEVEY